MDLAPGESVAFDGGIRVEMISKSGRSARLFIEAPRSVSIRRVETFESGTKHATMQRPERG